MEEIKNVVNAIIMFVMIIICVNLGLTFIAGIRNGRLHSIETNIENMSSVNVNMEKIEEGKGWIIYEDTNTGAKYMLVEGKGRAVMTRLAEWEEMQFD